MKRDLHIAFRSRGATSWRQLSSSIQAQAPQVPPQGATQQRELIYCAELMTHEEREAYRASMRAAPTWEAKAALRDAHRRDMMLRAQQRGPDFQCQPLQQRWRGGRGQ
ncbi:MAG: hypothetical protein MZW92_46755 [Comamonadaceae bacterium]|nr:hypothetical protein [Comamonadaceae bacterium]